MIKVPIFDPSNMGIKEKLDFVKQNIDRYINMTSHDAPIGYINFILPGYLSDNPDLTITPISPNLIDKAMVSGFYDEDIYLYINYFGNHEDLIERLHLYTSDSIIREKKVSPNWKLVVFFPQHTIDDCAGMEKFNMKYGLQLVGSEINLMNISKNINKDINHFNLVFMDVANEMKLLPAKSELIKEVATNHPDVQFLVYSSDSDTLELPGNCRAVVGSSFWKQFLTN